MTSTENKSSDMEDLDNANAIQDPNMLAALQDKLSKMTVKLEEDEMPLPPAVRRRVNALKNIQLETTKIEAQFFQEVHKLECEYARKYAPFYERRHGIVSGEVEPSKTETQWIGDEEEEEDKDDEDNEKQESDSDEKGIPGFWLTIFKNTDILAEMTQPHDEAIMEKLKDIRVAFPDSMGFTLEFDFAENEFFEEKILTKTYHMKSEPDDCDPVSFDGPEIVGSTGCTITWKKGKNVTQKVVKKKQRMRGKGAQQTRTVTKTIKEDSFFNFFSPPLMPDNDEECDSEMEAMLTTDFEIGQYIRERIVPKAVWYFTGEVIENESDLEDDDEDDESDSDYEVDVENNDNVVANETVTDIQKEECKQQ